MKMLQNRSQLHLGSRGSASRPLGTVAPTPQGFALPRQQAHTSQPQVVCALPNKKNNYFDFDDNLSNTRVDNFDYYPTQPADVGGYTQTLPQSWGSNTATLRDYAPQQPRYSAQRSPLYLPQDMDFEDDDDLFLGNEASGFGDNSDPAQRIVNGRHLIINNEIQANVVRVIAGEGGKVQKGVMSFKDAMSMAQGAGVDLVLLNPEASPPLCRLVLWSKYKYEVEKGQKKKVVKAVSVETKEIRLRPGTDTGDLKTKIKSAQKFLDKGHKVKLVMKFEGRELQHKDQGKAVMLKFVEDLGALGKVDGPINFKTGTYTALVSPTGRSLKEAGSTASAPEENVKPAASLSLPPAAPPAVPLPLPPRPVGATPGQPSQLPPPPAAPGPIPQPMQPAMPAAAPAPTSIPTRGPLPMPPMPAARPAGIPSPSGPSRVAPPLPPPLPRPSSPNSVPMARPGLAPPPGFAPPPMARPGPMRSPMAAPPPPPRQFVPASSNKK